MGPIQYTVLYIKGEKYNNKRLWPSVKHVGGSIMILGYISASGVGGLVRIDGNMRSEK